MSERYDYINNQKKRDDNKRVFKSIIYPEIESSIMDIYITTKQTDRLDLLAFEYYNDVNKWWIIAHANKIKGSLFLPMDTQIVIPMNLEKITQDFKKLNEL